MIRVLLIEDSPTQAAELELILESHGFEVEIAPDGETGLRDLYAARFDLVISDIVMPGISGYELCRAVKSSPETKHIPVILVTSLSDPMDVIAGLECGADNFLTKPYEPAYLIDRVRSILDNRQLRAAHANPSGVDVMFLGRKFTITSAKEQILDLLISTFEDTVRKKRALERSQAELSSALANLEAAHEELETFSYSVSHDLRAPLRHIGGFADLLLEEHAASLDATGLDYLQRVRRGVDRMSGLVDGLLELARVTRGGIRPTEVDVTKLVTAAIANRELAEPRANMDLRLHPLPRCRADANLLAVVFENLLANAWKFTSRVDRPVIEVGGATTDAEVQYYVRDNGAGFDMQRAEKLFTPFHRLHAANEFPGTGVGLATVRRVVHRHGGRIWAEAARGRGATFFIALPTSSEGTVT